MHRSLDSESTCSASDIKIIDESKTDTNIDMDLNNSENKTTHDNSETSQINQEVQVVKVKKMTKMNTTTDQIKDICI